MIRIEHLPADLFGLTTLQRAALSGRLVGQGVARRAGDIQPPDERYLPGERAHLARWLESQVTAQGPPVAVLESIRALAEPGVCCVVASARPALLLGPASQFWGALQAVKLAQVLSAAWATRVVPVLWNHADEHDATELEVARVLNRNFDLQEVRLEPLSPAGGPLHERHLDEARHGLGALRAVLEQLYGDLPHIERALDLFVPRAGESLPAAFTRGLHELLGAEGLVVVEAQVMGEEVAQALARLVGANVQELLQGAWEELPLVDPEERALLRHTPLVYRVDARGRLPLYAGGDGYRYEDEPGSRTPTELAAELVQEPRAWSAGEALRPAVRDLLLPLAACVGDERELLHHLGLRRLGEALELPATAFVPRLRATWVDEEDRRALERLGLSLQGALAVASGEVSEEQAAEAKTLVQELREICARARQELAQRKARLLELDPTLASPLRSASRELEEVLGRLWQKVGRVEATIGGRRARHARRLAQGLHPRGGPQDEVLGPFEWIARHGTGWIAEALTELDPFAGEHLALHIEA